MKSEGERKERIPVRAVLVGVALVSALSLAVPYTDIYMEASELAGCHFGVGPLSLLIFLVVAVNPLLKIISRRLAFSAGELLIILAMMLVAVGIPSYGLTAQLLPAITAPFYYADETNQWAGIFHHYLPEGLFVQDKPALKMFYEGAPGRAVPWPVWLPPLLCWGVLAFFFYLFMFSLSRVLEKQWVEHERLAFPLVQLPVEMAQAERGSGLINPFFKGELMWVGFAIPALVHLVNGLHFYFPAVPFINLRPRLTVFEGTPFWPLNRYFFIYFSLIGFSYFLPTDVVFSLWFFWMLWRFQLCAGSVLGVYGEFERPAHGQFSGAFVAFVLGTLWAGRHHLRRVLDSLLPGGEGGYRFALLGILLSTVGISVWCRRAGLSLGYAWALIVLFLVLCVGLGRAVGESGMIFAKALDTVTPSTLLYPLFGTQTIGSRNLALSTPIEYTFMFDLKTFLFPALMQGHKLRHSVNERLSRFVGAMALAVGVSVGVSIPSSLLIIHQVGGNNASQWFYHRGPVYAYSILATSISQPEGPDSAWWTAAISGTALTAALILLRKTVGWWPLHPVGYILAQSWETERIWFSFFLGWLLKGPILKYGGGRLFRRAKPFFLGLIFGEYGMAALWLIVDVITGRLGHNVFP